MNLYNSLRLLCDDDPLKNCRIISELTAFKLLTYSRNSQKRGRFDMGAIICATSRERKGDPGQPCLRGIMNVVDEPDFSLTEPEQTLYKVPTALWK